MNDNRALLKICFRNSALYTLIIFSGLLFLSACSFSLAEDITPPPGAEVPVIEPSQPLPEGPLYPMVHPDPSAGAQIYAEKCAPCHGVDGLGNGEMADELPFPPPAIGTADLARSSSPADWYAIITNGNIERRMPPFISLTDRQRWDVTAYLYALSSNPETVTLGEEVFQTNCASCHGEGGIGDGSEAADLSANPSNLIDQEYMANVTDEQLFQVISDGDEPTMPAFGEQLSPEERWALTAYLRSQTFLSPVAGISSQGTPEPPTGTKNTQTPGTPLATEEASGLGVVEGQVVSASGGDIPSNLTVALHGFDQMQQTFFAEIDASPEGEFIFENVEMPPGRTFLATVNYQEMGYSSDISVVDENTSNLALVIPYFETTTDTSILSVDRLHLLFSYLEPDILRVVEMYIISNPGNEIVVAPENGKPVLSFNLPEGATNLQFEDGVVGERYIQTQNGFGDVAVIRPGMGQHQVVYSYDVPYKSKLDFIRPLDVPVDAVVVLIPEDGLRVSGDQLRDMGTRDVQGIPYHLYSSGRLEAGTDLAIDISGRPRGGLGLAIGSNSSLVVGLVAFGVVLIVAGVWFYTRSRKERPEEREYDADDEYPAGENGDDLDVLFDAILALDDQYKAGELPQEAYQKRRSELKDRIKDLMGSEATEEPGGQGAREQGSQGAGEPGGRGAREEG